MQIKTTMKSPHIYYIISASKTKTNKQKLNAWMEVENFALLNVNWYSHYGKQYVVSQKMKNRATILFNNSLGICLQETKTPKKRYMHPHAHRNIIYNSCDIETT